jgi:hypothetical protein
MILHQLRAWTSVDSLKIVKKKSTKKSLSFQLKGKEATLELSVDTAGTLTAECLCLEQKKIIQAKDSIINEIKMDRIFKEDVKEVYKTHWYDMAARWFTGIMLLLLVLLLIFKLKLI